MRSPRSLSLAVACTAVTALSAPAATAAVGHAVRPPVLSPVGATGEGRAGLVGEDPGAAVGARATGASEPALAAPGPDIPGPAAGDLDASGPGEADSDPLDELPSAPLEAEPSEGGALGEPDGAEASAAPADPGEAGELDDLGDLGEPDATTSPSGNSTADTAVPGDVPESPVRRGASERPEPEDLRGVHAGEGAEPRRSMPLLALGGALVAGTVLAAGWFAVRRPREF